MVFSIVGRKSNAAEIDNSSSETLSIPISVLKDRSISVLEALVEYLKEVKNLTYHEIAELTNRDDRTIWTVYNRVKKKRSGGVKK